MFDKKSQENTTHPYTSVDVQKDAKFSLRALMVLSIATIAVFGFGLDLRPLCPKPEPSDFRIFSRFTMLIILGQGMITLLTYLLNYGNIRNDIKNHEKEADRLRANKADHENAKISVDPQYKPHLEEKIQSFTTKIIENKKFIRRTKLLHVVLNGLCVFVLAIFALITTLVSCRTNNAVVSSDLWITLIWGIIGCLMCILIIIYVLGMIYEVAFCKKMLELCKNVKHFHRKRYWRIMYRRFRRKHPFYFDNGIVKRVIFKICETTRWSSICWQWSQNPLEKRGDPEKPNE